MKVTIDIEFSAAEARTMLVLPNIATIKGTRLKQVEAEMMEKMANFSPETILKNWASGASSNADWLPNPFAAFGQPGAGRKQLSGQ